MLNLELKKSIQNSISLFSKKDNQIYFFKMDNRKESTIRKFIQFIKFFKKNESTVFFSTLLKANMLEECVKMINLGFQPSIKLEKLLKNKIHEDVQKNPRNLNFYMNEYKSLSDDFNFKINLILNNNHRGSVRDLVDLIKEDFRTENFANNIVDKLNKKLKSYKIKRGIKLDLMTDAGFKIVLKNSQSLKNLGSDLWVLLLFLNYLDESTVNTNKILESKKIMVSMSDKLSKILKNSKHLDYQSKNDIYYLDLEDKMRTLDQFLKKCLSLESNLMLKAIDVKKINKESVILYNNLKISKLSEFDPIINKIVTQYKKIQEINDSHVKVVCANKMNDFNKFILNYKKIDQEYIKSIKNIEGKTVEELFLECSSNISIYFDNVLKSENEKYVKNLSVINRKNSQSNALSLEQKME